MVEKEFDLSPKQREIVEFTGSKPMSVEAGPGAGKTRVIVERVKFLVKEMKVRPESLLVITFTRKAAEELKTRLADSDIAKSDIDLMQISTIHGFCSKILERHGAIGLDVIDDDLNEKNNMFLGRHLKDLGFIDEYTIKEREVRDIVRKYNEYTTFKVDTRKLVDYIKETHPISNEYLDFVHKYMEENDGKFPQDEILDDDDLKKSYYNAKYLKIAQSYPEYLKLLERENLTDFALMQVKTLEFLEKEPETVYKNVLIDEFQDTDPVQMKIFEILMNNSDSFMVVGDIEQSIYGFRGSIENYFEKLYLENDDIEQKDLSTNYRSTNEIIDFTEDYIISQRSANASKSDAVGDRNVNRDMYYMVSDDNAAEAKQILDLIINLKENGKIRDYNDIGILVRSVKGAKNCVNPLIEKLEEAKIPYQVKGRSDLLDRPEVKSFLTLINHIIYDEDTKGHIFTSWEKDWLTLRAFTGEEFPQVLVNLSDETKEILNKVQDDFEQKVIDTEKVVYKEKTNKTSRVKKFSGVLKRDDDILIEIFNRVERPVPTNDNLVNWGVTDQDDLTFFYLLNNIRDEYLDEDKDFDEKDTILKIFLKILDITDYLDEEFVNDEDNLNKVENIALLTDTFFNYEQVRNPKDLAGVFWFLYRNIDEYGAFVDETKGVQIMTVHKAKGLEFPVVIVGSLKEGKFPMDFKDPNPDSGWSFIGGKMRPVYYTPNDCLEYIPFETIEEEIKAHDEEEERIIYVAMTRAEDTLILSTLAPGSEQLFDDAMKNSKNPNLDARKKQEYFDFIPKGGGKVESIINKNSHYCKALRKNYEDINPIVCKDPNEEKEEKERLNLSFTAIENYAQCPFKFRLKHSLGFKTSQNKYMERGLFIHKAFEIINKKIKENDNVYIGDEAVKSEVANLFYRSYIKAEDDEDKKNKLKKITEDILYYYNTIGKDLEIIDSEVSFYIKKDNYSLNGVVDLIYRKQDGTIGIIDYKNTKSADVPKYKKQLYTYIIGLSDKEHRFKDMKIEELNIYAIKSRELKPIPISDEDIEELEAEIDQTAIDIENRKFASKKSKECDKCQFSVICKSTKKDIDILIIKPKADKKFCFNCGNELKPEMKFCPSCGTKQE